MDGYKRFAEYSLISQKRLRRRRLQAVPEEHDGSAEDIHLPGPVEQEQRQQSTDESVSDSEHEAQRFPDESDAASESERNSVCGSINPEREEALPEEHRQDDGESIEESSVASDDSENNVASDDSENNVASDDNENNDDQLHDRVEEAQRDDNELLYEGAPLTTAESSIAILSTALRHNMSNALLSDVLRLVELHCPPGNKCKKTLYHFKKSFAEIGTRLIRHHFCGNCVQAVDRPDSICPSCESAENIKYFIEGPIISQLKALYKRPGFQELLQHRHDENRQNDNNYKDIYDGAVYKDLCQEDGFLNNRANISFTWYTDGINMFKSSKFSIWPFYLIINELPFAARTKKENIILAGLWFGDKKPVPNLFLAPLQDSIRLLRQGIDVETANADEHITVKGIIICGTCDLPAKALFLNMKQYNGKFGCQKCKQEGVYLFGQNVRVWPYEPLNLRSDRETVEHARQAFHAGTSVCGVKGPTILSMIVHETMRAISVDVMHCVAEGIVKNLINLWFSPSFSDHHSSISQHVDLVDTRLRSLTPPSFVQSLPRSISEHLAFWKAHELKAWFFYYSIPCVYDLLKKRYFDHYILLVQGISLLCKSSIPPDDVLVAERALNEFVRRFERLYGRRYMSNNLHQLLHLPENVRQFGPLWTTSCFPFEDLNGRLKFMVSGSNSAQLQIYKGMSMFLRLTTLKTQTLIEGQPAHDFCESLSSKRGRIKRHEISDSVYIVGKYTKLRQLSPELARVLPAANMRVTSCFYYKRLLKKNVMYSCTEYQRSKRTNSAFAAYSVGCNQSRVGNIRCFLRISNCRCPTLCGCIARNYAIVRPCLVREQFATCIDNRMLSDIHTVVGYENNEQAVDISRLQSVCFYCQVQGTAASCIIEPVNRVE